jgi:hypothetical protein
VHHLNAVTAAVDRDGVEVATVAGMEPNPALVESRQQSIALVRVLAALRMPSGDEDASRPQRRDGVRQSYGMGGGPARLRRCHDPPRARTGEVPERLVGTGEEAYTLGVRGLVAGPAR